MEIAGTIKFPLHKLMCRGMTVGKLKKLMIEKDLLDPNEKYIIDVNSNYDVSEDAIIHEHDDVHIRIKIIK